MAARLVDLLYWAALDREPDPEGLEHHQSRILEDSDNIVAIFEEILSSDERREIEAQRKKEHRAVNRIVSQDRSHILYAPTNQLRIAPRTTYGSLSQVFISDNKGSLPELLQIAADNSRQCFREHRYQLYDKESTRQFIAQHYDPRIIRAYDKLAPYAYKADLGRYCIINRVGGWYADMSLLVSMSIWPIPPEIGMIYFADKGERASSKNLFRIQPGLFYSQPANPALELAIEMIAENCESEYYGNSALSPTGPELLGRAIARSGIEANHIIGEFKALTPDCEQENKAYILPTGEVLAHYKTTWAPNAAPGQIASMGAEGTNDYGKMWSEKRIYEAPDSAAS